MPISTACPSPEDDSDDRESSGESAFLSPDEDPKAFEYWYELLSDRLRKAAKAQMSGERKHHTFQTMDVVAQLYLEEFPGCKVIARCQSHSDDVISVAFSEDSTLLATASCDSTACIARAKRGETLSALEGHSDAVTSVVFSPDNRMLATTSYDNTARLWSDTAARRNAEQLARGDEDRRQRAKRSRERALSADTGAAFTPQGASRRAANADRSPGEEGGMEFEAAGHILRGHRGIVVSAAFSPKTGARLATASFDATARLWDTKTGEQVAVLDGHRDAVVSVAFSPDGERLATASYDNTVRLWSTATGRELAVLEGHTAVVVAVAFSPDGRRLATGSNDTTARVWDADTGDCIEILRGHDALVAAVAFSPEGLLIATGSYDGTARVWDAISCEPRLTLKEHEAVVTSIAFSPDGTVLATGSHDTTARLWDTKTGKRLDVLREHEGIVVSVAFSRDGTRLATASHDRTACLWDVTLPKGKQTAWKSEEHFYNSMTRIMKNILIDYAKKKNSIKHGGQAGHVPLTDVPDIPLVPDKDVKALLNLDRALDELAKSDRDSAMVFDMHYFMGMPNKRIAQVMEAATSGKNHKAARRGWSERSVERRLSATRKWLAVKLGNDGMDAIDGKC